MSKLFSFLKEAITESNKPDQLDTISDVLNECTLKELLTPEEIGELTQLIYQVQITLKGG
jgi:hypothetical protein